MYSYIMERQRKPYQTLSFEVMRLETEQTLLVGSVKMTSVPITFDEVSVEDFQRDKDFGVDEGQDFKSITFE